jgi:hypothetical protein
MGQPQGIFSIDDYHRMILFIENKQQVAFHTPAQIDDALNRSSIALFWKYAPLDGVQEEARSAMDPFRNVFQVTPNNSPLGLVSLPSGLGPTSSQNYARLSSAVAVSYNNTINPTTGFPYGTQYWDIDFVNDDERAKRLMSQLKPVTIARPIAQTVGNGMIQLYPQLPNTAIFTYLGLPVACFASYSQVGRVLTYQQNTSIQMQWNDSFFNELINGALIYLGLNLDDQAVVEFMTKATGGA